MSILDILRITRHIVIMPRRVWRHKITSAEGERLIVLPLAEDPIEALQGILKDKGRTDISSTDALRLWREEDNAAMDRKWREYYRD